MTIIVGIIAALVGLVVGFVGCALMSTGRAEDAYAEGYDQACKDKDEPKDKWECRTPGCKNRRLDNSGFCGKCAKVIVT